MRRTDAGRGYAKAIISLVILGAVAYAAIKIVPVYVSNYELEDYIREQTPFWVTQRTSAEAILTNIIAKAQDLGLPLEREEVKVDTGGGRVRVVIDYTVSVDLKVYTLQLHFTPSAENRSL